MPTRTDLERDADELDEELDLPPPDDDDDGEPDGIDDLPADVDDPGGLDDADAIDLDVGGDELDEADDGGDDDREIDVGALDEGIDDEEGRAADAEADGAVGDDDEIEQDSPSEDDGGAEGTSEDPGALVDERALPELDDDAHDDAHDEDLLAQGFALIEGAGAPVPCCAVSVLGGRVAAAGEALLTIEEGARAARSMPFDDACLAVAIGDEAILAATARGQILLARDGSATRVSLGSWRTGVGPSMGLWPTESAAPAVELAATPGRFWIRAGTSLACIRSMEMKQERAALQSKPPAPVRERGVLAITASRGVLIALASGPEGLVIERLRGDDEGSAATPLRGEAQRIAERDRFALRLAAAAGGRALAITDQRRIALSRDGGEAFTALDLGVVPALAFAGDEADAPLFALLAQPETGALAIVEIEGEEATKIGEIAGASPEGASHRTTAAMAWDASRDLLWIACAAGLFALGRPQRH